MLIRAAEMASFSFLHTHTRTHTYLQCISKKNNEVLQIQHQVRVVTVRLRKQTSVSVCCGCCEITHLWINVRRAVVRPYRVRPQGGDDFGQRQLPELLHVRSVDQTLRGVKDVILDDKEAGRGGRGKDTFLFSSPLPSSHLFPPLPLFSSAFLCVANELCIQPQTFSGYKKHFATNILWLFYICLSVWLGRGPTQPQCCIYIQPCTVVTNSECLCCLYFCFFCCIFGSIFSFQCLQFFHIPVWTEHAKIVQKM